MADTGIFATTAEVQRKVGANADTTANTEAYINQFMTEAESFINAYCNFNYSDVYSSLNVDKKGILKKWASAMAAVSVLNYSSTNFSRLGEWQTRLNVLTYEIEECKQLMTKAQTNTFVQAA